MHNVNPTVFYFVLTLFLGGGAAVLTGRNFAANWRTPVAVALAGVGLAVAVRFLHFALNNEELFAASAALLDAVPIVLLALLGFRWRRTEQMTSQYYWLYERTGPLSWRQKPNEGPSGG